MNHSLSRFPRTEQRERLADVLRAHYNGMSIVDDPLEWLPGADHAGGALGLTGSEYAATARAIADATDCTIGDAAGQLDLIAAVLNLATEAEVDR